MKKRLPKFGDRLRGIYAGESNPQRDGIYVETIRRTGNMNRGTFYRLTDGKGHFWTYPATSTAFLDDLPSQGAAVAESPAGLPVPHWYTEDDIP